MLKLNTQNKAFQYLFIGSVSAFFSLMSFEAFFPIAMSSADSSASATLELDVEPTLGMALSDTSLSLAYNGETEILPTSAGVTATGSLDVYVATNGASGYSLSMYTPEHADMKHINSSVSNSITSTTGGANLAKNTWGFYNSTLGSWIGIGEGSNNSTTIIDNGASVNVPCDLSTTAPTSCANGTIDSTTITFGANISDSLPAGRYTNDVVFTAISNVPETRVAYTLNYNVNGGTGSIAPTHAAYPGTTGFASGSSLTPPTSKQFLGWALTSGATTPDYTPADTISTLSLIEDAIAAGQSISETQGGVIQLYAVYAYNTHSVTISTGTGIASTTGTGTYSVGQTVNISASPSSGYNFSSWTVNSGGASLASTTSSSTSFTMPDANVAITANGVLAVQNCSSTVHPTTTTGCKMADNKTWILGNSGNYITWNNMFTGATNQNNHNATVKSGICPAGYSAPTIVDYDNLIIAYGGTSLDFYRNGYQESTGALYSMLGLSGNRYFWSSTEYNSGSAYILSVSSNGSSSSYSYNKGDIYYVLCYK